MTRHPDSLDEINYVVEFIADPCDAPLEIWVRSFRKALLKAVIMYYAFDMVQVFTSYVRPARAIGRARSAGHGSRKGPKGKPKTWLRRWQRWLSFDPWDWLGKQLPGQKGFHGMSVSPNTVTFWQIFDHVQRVTYWMFVFDLVTTFFYDWLSGVKKSTYCQEQNRMWLSAYQDDYTFSGFPEPVPYNCPNILKQRGPITWFGFNGVCNSPFVNVAMSCGVSRIPGLPPLKGFRIGAIIRGTMYRSDEVQEGVGSASLYVTVPAGNTTIITFYEAEEGFGHSDRINLTIMGSPGSGGG